MSTALPDFSPSFVALAPATLTYTAATTTDFAAKWAIGTDEAHWNAWMAAVAEPSTYTVTDTDLTNSQLFSEFWLSI